MPSLLVGVWFKTRSTAEHLPLDIQTADSEHPIPLPDCILQVEERNPRAAQVYREMVNRAQGLGCFHRRDGQQVRIEDDSHNMLVAMPTDLMLEKKTPMGHEADENR